MHLDKKCPKTIDKATFLNKEKEGGRDGGCVEREYEFISAIIFQRDRENRYELLEGKLY